ncbi:MAG: PilZ domain-containing protein [Proteobacteria bacterium]|nr:PilZ domain-containing protein [Pseudomonadota bacterium]
MLLRILRKLLSHGFRGERRIAPRYADGSRVEVEMALQSFHGRLLDVSETGARLVSGTRVDVGRSILVRIPRSNGYGHLVLVVRWVVQKSGCFVFGAVPDGQYAFAQALLRTQVGVLKSPWRARLAM